MNVKGMKWYNTLQFIVMCLAFGVVAIDWGVGLWMTLAFGVVTIVKVVAEKRVGNPSLDTPTRLSLLAVVAYWLCHVAGLLYSADVAGAVDVVSRKAILLLAPLCVLLSDMSYIGRDHLRAAFYTLLLAVAGLFFYDWITGSFEDMNHSYVALYVVTAAAFVYRELAVHGSAMPLWLRLALYGAALMCVVFTIYIDSRAGILCLYGVEVLCGLHFAARRGWWRGALLAVLLVGLTFTAEKTLPNHNSRITVETVMTMTEEESEEWVKTHQDFGKYRDARMAINVTALRAIADRPVFGYGVGDYDTVLLERYETEGFPVLKAEHHNAHNQYTETALATGAVGLALLLWWLLMPLCVAWRRRTCVWEVLVPTFIVMFCMLFESIVERQMGMQFVALLYAMMVLAIRISRPSSGGVK